MEGRVEELNKVWQEAMENSRERKEGVTKLNKKIKDIQSNKVSHNNLFLIKKVNFARSLNLKS